jgi:hypothetical protein
VPLADLQITTDNGVSRSRFWDYTKGVPCKLPADSNLPAAVLAHVFDGIATSRSSVIAVSWLNKSVQEISQDKNCNRRIGPRPNQGREPPPVWFV